MASFPNVSTIHVFLPAEVLQQLTPPLNFKVIHITLSEDIDQTWKNLFQAKMPILMQHLSSMMTMFSVSIKSIHASPLEKSFTLDSKITEFMAEFQYPLREYAVRLTLEPYPEPDAKALIASNIQTYVSASNVAQMKVELENGKNNGKFLKFARYFPTIADVLQTIL